MARLMPLEHFRTKRQVWTIIQLDSGVSDLTISSDNPTKKSSVASVRSSRDVQMAPDVSVAMPVYNGSRWLTEAINSIIRQTYPNFELLVVDDGSTDDTPRLLDNYVNQDKRIRVLRQNHSGLVAALNRCLAEARGSFFARLDADDRVASKRLEAQTGFLRSNVDFGLVGSWARKIDANGRPLGKITPTTKPELLSQQLMRNNPFLHSSITMRTELVRRLGGYRSAFEAAEDYDLWLRVSEVSKVTNLPELLIDYRWHRESVTHSKTLRAAFSSRLAQRSAYARRHWSYDPADALEAPPNWNAAESLTSFYADDAVLYRVLALADANASLLMPKELDFSILTERAPALSHVERNLAVRACFNYLRRVGYFDKRLNRVLRRVLQDHPRIAARAVWSVVQQSLRRTA